MLFRGNEFTSPAGFTFAVVLAAPSATLPLHVSRKLSGASYVVVVLQGSLKDLLRRNSHYLSSASPTSTRMVLRLLNCTRSAGVTMLLLAVHFGRFVRQENLFTVNRVLR